MAKRKQKSLVGKDNTAACQKALANAERRLKCPGDDDPREVFISPENIKTMPVLFQPRRFSFKTKTINDHHVKRLQRRSDIVGGELDEVVVIKIGKDWIIVDGHHRLEAYQRNRRRAVIKCRWFGGSVREAYDESVKRNAGVKLEVDPQDLQEQAWRRVVMGGWSKKQISEVCSVSETMVAFMRRVDARYRRGSKNDTPETWQQFRTEIDYSGGIDQISWAGARVAMIRAETTQRTTEERAQTLARLLRSRFGGGELTDDVQVTARALAIYDPDLIEPLAEALHSNAVKGPLDELPENELQQLLERSRTEQAELDKEQAIKLTADGDKRRRRNAELISELQAALARKPADAAE